MIEIFKKVVAMLGFNKSKPVPISMNVDVSRAVQRNERAQQNVQKELEKIKMADTLRDLAGKI